MALAVLLVVAAVALRVAWEGGATAQDDPPTGLDCANYSSQADAREVLEDDPSDPNGLDGDGTACDSLR